MDLDEPAKQAAWGLLVDLRTTVLPSAAGEMYAGEQREELALLSLHAGKAAPLLAGALPGLTEAIQRLTKILLADPGDYEAWMELADVRVRLTEKLGTAT